MNKCDFCKNDSNCSVAKRRECIVRDYFWFEFERAQEDDTKTIAGLLFDYHGNSNPEEIAKYLVRNNIGLKTR